MMANNLLISIRLLAAAARAFADKCVAGLTANEGRCRELVEQSGRLVRWAATVVSAHVD